jgi:hypothetical protein
MTAAEEIEASLIEEILAETIAALPRMRAEELEELERRAAALAERFRAGSAVATARLRVQMGSLKVGLESTGGSLAVLERILDREGSSPWVV